MARGHAASPPPELRPVTVELDVRPPGPYRLPSLGRDGVMRRRGGALVRLLPVGLVTRRGLVRTLEVEVLVVRI